jgi:hypothetical protein
MGLWTLVLKWTELSGKVELLRVLMWQLELLKLVQLWSGLLKEYKHSGGRRPPEQEPGQ